MLRRTAAWIAAAAAFALANLGHLSNPGYFSHDELQWGWQAQQGLVYDWLDGTPFQYRPLTFQLWLPIARGFFGHPHACHALWVALGFGVCALLFAVLRRAGATPRVAFFGAAAFALNPYAMYVHGWVATLAELLWTACALGIAWFVLDPQREARTAAIAVFLLTTLALLSKETALAIAPLLGLAWLLTREARWRSALLASAAPTAVYLALRLPILLFGERPDGAYAWSLAHVPQRWAEFQAWPLIPTALEMAAPVFAPSARLTLVAVLAALLPIAVLRADRRLGLLLLAGSAIATGPAIVLATGYPQYGYAASALAWACIAAAWPAMRGPARAVVLLALVVNAWHGVNVQREMLRTGRIEAVFTASARPWLETPGHELVLTPEIPSDAWIYRRLTESLPYARREVRIGVGGGQLSIDTDGHVVSNRAR